MAQPPRPGDSHGNLLWKIVENTFEGGGGGAVAVGTAIGGSTPDRVLQTGPLGQLESGAVTTTELGFLAGATSNIQVQINALSGGIVGIESDADATAMWITAEENIGIGTSAPVALLQIQARTPLAGTGTVSSSGTTVTGVGTAFLSQLHIGDSITASGQIRTVFSIASNTSLTTSASFSPVLPAATAFTYQLALERWTNDSGAILGFQDVQGRILIGSTTDVVGFSAFLNVNKLAVNPSEVTRAVSATVTGIATTAANASQLRGLNIVMAIGAGNTQNWTNTSAVAAWNNTVTVEIGATGTIATLMGFQAALTQQAVGATVTDALLFLEGTPGGVGPITNFTGIALRNRTSATNNCNLRIGPTTQPAGNFSIYNNSTFSNYFEGSFGIGIAAPDGKLHVFSGSAGTLTPDTFADDLVIENSTFVGLTFACPNTTVATIAFADPQDSDVGSINYNHTLDVLSFKVGGTEFVYFEGTGQVGIGISTPSARLHVFSATVGGNVANAFADELVLENNDHGGLTILTPSTHVGTIFFGDNDDNDVGQISYNHSLDTLTLTAGTVNVVNCVAAACNPGADNTIRLGSAAVRWTEVFAVAGTINTSDAREKNTILGVSLTLAQNLVDNIIPRSYVWNNKQLPGTHYGFVAQEIEAVVRRFVAEPDDFAPLHYDKASDQYGLRMNELLPFLWRVVQDQQKRIQTLEYAYGH